MVGGSGNQIERRYGSVKNGVFFAYDQAPENEGGTLRQLFANGTYTFNGKSCTVPLEHEPADANIHNVGRRSLPLFGLGLVDAMPDGFFDLIVALEPSSTRGTVLRRVSDFPDSRDPNQGIGKTRVQRFGIKDQQTNLVSFAGDAYINEMGISTQSCFKGTLDHGVRDRQPAEQRRAGSRRATAAISRRASPTAASPTTRSAAAPMASTRSRRTWRTSGSSWSTSRRLRRTCRIRSGSRPARSCSRSRAARTATARCRS